jgi:cell division GTPase FtsZ
MAGAMRDYWRGTWIVAVRRNGISGRAELICQHTGRSAGRRYSSIAPRPALIGIDDLNTMSRRAALSALLLGAGVVGLAGLRGFQRRRCARRVLTVGIGGGGMRALEALLATGHPAGDAIAMCTDNQDLAVSGAGTHIALGPRVARGLGAGSNPELGREAAHDSHGAIRRALREAALVLLLASMGGGTGTGATPVIADIARADGALVVAVATNPFQFEGVRRRRNAREGVARIAEVAEMSIVIASQQVLRCLPADATMRAAFADVDQRVARVARAALGDSGDGEAILDVATREAASVFRRQGPRIVESSPTANA